MPKPQRLSSSAAFILLSGAHGALASPCLEYGEFVHEVGLFDTPGSASGVCVSGPLAYVADGSAGLRILDVSDPAAPVEVGQFDTQGIASSVALGGEVAYVADGAGLLGIDVSIPSAPSLAFAEDTPGYCLDVCVHAGRLYAADGSGGLRIYQLADPRAPGLLAVIPTDGWRPFLAVAASDSFVFIAMEHPGIVIYDLAGWEWPVATVPVHTVDLALDGDRLYATGEQYRELTIVDVADPGSPEILAQVLPPELGGSGKAVAAGGGFAYVVDEALGLMVFDVSNPMNPVLRESEALPAGGAGRGLHLDGAVAWVAAGSAGLMGVDVSDPGEGHLAALDTPFYAFEAAIAGSYVYVADGNSGLQVIDVSDPADPWIAGARYLGAIASSVAVSGSYAYVANTYAGLQIVRVSDPSNPVLVRTVAAPGSDGDLMWVVLGAAHAYLASSLGVQVVDVSVPASATTVGSAALEVRGRPALRGEHLFVPTAFRDESDGIHVLDVSVPAAPTVVSVRPIPGGAFGAEVVGDGLFVLDGGGRLLVYDISNPPFPDSLGRVEGVACWALRADASRELLYVSEYGARVQVFDAHDPSAVAPLGCVSLVSDAGLPQENIAVSGDLAVVACGGAGVTLHRPQCSAMTAVPPAVPFPSSRARPALFAGPVPAADRVRVRAVASSAERPAGELVDARGRLVRRMAGWYPVVDGWELAWDGRDERGERAPPGVYFARVRAAGGEATVKVLLSP